MADQNANTPAPSGLATPQSTGSPQAGAESAPEWAGTFKDPADMWKSYTNLKSQYDKISNSKKSEPAEPQANPYRGIASRIDQEAITGQFGPETQKIIDELGFSSDAIKEFVNYRAQKQLDPIKQFFPDANHDELFKVANDNIDQKSREAFQSLIAAGQFEAASVIIKNVVGSVKAKGDVPKIGEVGGKPGGGYKDYNELYKAMKDKRFEWDKEYQEQVKRKFEATPQSIIDEWQRINR